MDQILAIRTFVRVAEAGSFAKAADTMNLPRSSVSKLVQDLEAHLGTKLVERTTRSVTMTTEGVAYHERALKLLADLDDMDGTVAGSRSAPKGKLRVDIGSVLANQILIPALSDFQHLYPDIDLMLGVSDRPADLISEGIDCVIRGGALSELLDEGAQAVRVGLRDLCITRLSEWPGVAGATGGYRAASDRQLFLRIIWQEISIALSARRRAKRVSPGLWRRFRQREYRASERAAVGTGNWPKLRISRAAPFQ